MKNIVLLLFFCTLNFASNFDEVKLALIKEFKTNYPQIEIISLELNTQSSLPEDFNQYVFLKLGNHNFEKADGFIKAEFKTPEQFKKNIFFKYFLKAKLEVLQSTRLISRNENLSPASFKIVKIPFDKVPSGILKKDEIANLIAKSNIRENMILKYNMFKTKTLIQRNDSVYGVMKDGDLSMIIELKAMQSGNLNQRIRLKNKEGKVVHGKVISKNYVEIK
ncbi:flagellar basal body P-ring formation protein FlgA [Campylobacter volucris]|uniref:Flagella basal body P-ring formation protein FlgA n=1 Tax=Campylobacter volucris TaxID=1031542 RepID=A0AAE5YHU4_9BACT|nr:flagellar basal body P-ring formation protein FlgA [Campylobacter volucris]QBL14250.1 flagellar basal body P-ring formation protein FlgA [Campylobacter volucris]TXK67586.1 flagellar basal body P-ring formation protein FlgA [Campylobacter volucris]